VYMHSLMTVEINDCKLIKNVLFFSPACGQGRQHSEKSVLLIATCCSHFQDLDLDTTPWRCEEVAQKQEDYGLSAIFMYRWQMCTDISEKHQYLAAAWHHSLRTVISTSLQ